MSGLLLAIFLYDRDMKTLLLTLFLTFFVSPSFAKVYDYKQLQSKDYDEMIGIVRTQIKLAKKSVDEDDESAAQFHLKEALRIIMSRPNTDNLIPKLLPEVRKELVQFEAFDDQMLELVDEAIDRVKDEKASTTSKATSLFMLENIMAEIKPEIANNEKYKNAYEKIRDAKIKVPNEAKADRKVRGMFQSESPSEKAKKILDQIAKTKTK